MEKRLNHDDEKLLADLKAALPPSQESRDLYERIRARLVEACGVHFVDWPLSIRG